MRSEDKVVINWGVARPTADAVEGGASPIRGTTRRNNLWANAGLMVMLT
jgi:hypothetical protein